MQGRVKAKKALLRIQPTVFVFYSFVFFFVAVWAEGDAAEIISVTTFVLMAGLAFYVRVSNLMPLIRDLFSVGLRQSWKDVVSLMVVLFLAVSGIGYMYAERGIPIFSDVVEVSRMELVEDYGILYRVSTQSINILGLAVLFLFVREKVSILVFWGVQVVLVLLVFSLGFRSLLVDYIILVFIAWFVSYVCEGRFRLSMVFKVAPIFFLLFSAAFFAISYLTFVREGHENFALAVGATLHRIFILNYEVNFWRIYSYVDAFGHFYGLTFLTDFLAAASGSYESMQEMVTRYFNNVNSDLFIMTPTVYGEFFLNFGYLSALLVFPVLLLYRIFVENMMVVASRVGVGSSVIFGASICVIYFFPRITVTGGLSNAFLIIFGSYFIIFILVAFIVGIMRVFVSK